MPGSATFQEIFFSRKVCVNWNKYLKFDVLRHMTWKTFGVFLLQQKFIHSSTQMKVDYILRVKVKQSHYTTR
jgi:hypothetical protein